MEKLLSLSDPHIPYLKNRDYDSYLIERIRWNSACKSLLQCQAHGKCSVTIGYAWLKEESTKHQGLIIYFLDANESIIAWETLSVSNIALN
jgi:hypothetical protein